MKRFLKAQFLLSVVFLTACASAPYQYGTGRIELDMANSPPMKEQILIGRPNKFLDAADWFWPNSLFAKLLLWDKNMDSHQISPQTIDNLKLYVERNDLRNVQVLVNYYSPGNQWRRLAQNRNVNGFWRYTLGALSVTMYTILPGRFFGGDAYNPYTNTLYLYSDVSAVALHEGGHAKDFGGKKCKGWYAFFYLLPFANLYYEAKASNDALSYLAEVKQPEGQKGAYEILYPAYSTYLFSNFSSYLVPSPSPWWYLGVIPGHIAGQVASAFVDIDESEDNNPPQDE